MMAFIEAFRKLPALTKALLGAYCVGLASFWIGPTSKIIYTDPLDVVIGVFSVCAILAFVTWATVKLESEPSLIDWNVKSPETNANITRAAIRIALLICVALFATRWIQFGLAARGP